MNPSRTRSGAPSDPGLLSRIAAGDAHALGALYDRHGVLLYTLAVAIAGSHETAEKAVAAAFARVWREPEEWEPSRTSVLAWLTATVRALALEERRLESAAPTTSPAASRHVASLR